MSGALEQRADWGYAPAPESTDIVKLDERYGLFIGGEFVQSKSGRWFTTIDPATEEALAEVAYAGPEDVDLAVRSAREAFGGAWHDLPGSERAMDVNAIDVTGVPKELRAKVEELAAENVKRVHRAPEAHPFSAEAQSPYEITALMEFKTVWHPIGA